jgi:hypothetical protein
MLDWINFDHNSEIGARTIARTFEHPERFLLPIKGKAHPVWPDVLEQRLGELKIPT